MLRRALPGAARALRGAAAPGAPAGVAAAGALAPAARSLASAPCAAAPRNAVEKEPYNRARSVMPLADDWPILAPDAYVAPNATVVGAVRLDDKVSVWPGAVLRADLSSISVGAFSNIQDRVVVGTARCVRRRPRAASRVALRREP